MEICRKMTKYRIVIQASELSRASFPLVVSTKYTEDRGINTVCNAMLTAFGTKMAWQGEAL